MNGRRLLIGGILLGLVLYLLSNGITEHLDTPASDTSKTTSWSSWFSSLFGGTADAAKDPKKAEIDPKKPATDGTCTTEVERIAGRSKGKTTGICATIPAGGQFQWLRDFLCSNSAGCKEDEESSDGLCYKKCPPGWKGSVTMCIRQYQGYDCGPYPDGIQGGADPLTLRVPTRVVTEQGVGAICGPNEERKGELCYPKCAEGYDAGLTTCTAQNVNVGVGTIPD